ncbi:MAG: DVU_1553 family AMP-dependent CoA ligase [Anaerovoracaceae bacterium]|jgi:phenylacetate-CoA ligase
MKSQLFLDQWIINKIGSSSKLLTREELEAYQFKKLIETLNWVKQKSKFYNKILSDIKLDKIQKIEDIQKMSFTTVKDLSEHYLDMVCVDLKEISRIVSLNTSGTTGIPKRIFFTKEDQELTIDYFHHGMQYIVGTKDTVLILLPYERPGSVGDLLKIGLERLGAKTITYGFVRKPKEVLSIIKKEKVTSLVGNPDQVLTLAQMDLEDSYNYRYLCGSQIQSVLLSTDYIPYSTCRMLEKIWNCKVFEHYGMTEMGLGCAVSCHVLEGYHPREADLFIEIINPETGQPANKGECGEIVFTTLTRKAMPLLRYRTGDISRWLTEPCPCGSILKRLDKVRKRSQEKRIKGGIYNE